MGALFTGPIADGGLELDESGLALLLASCRDRCVDASEVVVAIGDVKDLPSVGEETLLNILGECDIGIAINGDIYSPAG